MEAPARKTPRFWIAVQPSIIRLYKVAGLVALTAILVGLIGFLIVNIFYFFDHTWVKPVPLEKSDHRVIEASTQVADARERSRQLEAEKLELASQLGEVERAVKADEAFLAEVGAQADNPKTPEQWLVHREVEKAKLDRENQAGRREPLQARLDSMAKRIQDQQDLVKRLEQSPYLRAADHDIVLAFVPNQNLTNINEREQTKLYACSWGLLMCHVVGRIKTTLPGEVQDTHPHDESVQRGVMVEIDLTTPSAAKEKVLFAGAKPLWLF
jgi:hypothetical protein